MKYILWSADKDGDGHLMMIGKYDEVEDIEIRIGHFNKDVVLTIETENEITE